jgi:hypothetical protein
VDADVEGVARVEKDDAWQSDPGCGSRALVNSGI